MITAILDPRAGLDLVGAKVYSETKHGRDVGTLVGRDPIGVLATADTAEIVAMQADCVLYTPRTTDLDEVCTILASGKNVATTAFLFHPRCLPAPDRDRLLAACNQGGTSVHGSDHPAGARGLVGVREHRHHIRQHGFRSARRADQRDVQRVPGVQ
jgi:hypothetical protein